MLLSCDLGFQGRNPFRRDLRKSIYGDGRVFSQWMETVYDRGDMQVRLEVM